MGTARLRPSPSCRRSPKRSGASRGLSYSRATRTTKTICSHGWEVCPALEPLRTGLTIDKPTFGSAELGRLLLELDAKEPVGSITLVGLCTDICVISNAMIAKAFLPEIPVTVDAACCAGVTPESHRNSLSAMKMCQVRIENE